MRHCVGLFGLVSSAIIIAVAARYGFKTSDSDFDGYIWAFIYGAITFAGLFGHMVAVRLWWRHKMRWLSAAVFIVCALTLVISLSNSIGAMAGRANTTQATRTKAAESVRADRRDLETKQKERAAMKFDATDGTAVLVAQSKADAATAARKAECDKRGPLCRGRETDEATALADALTASKNKAATDHARELDDEIKTLKTNIDKAGPVLEANSQGSALTRLFGLPDNKAARMSTYQNLGMGIVLELLVAFSLIIYELMGEKEHDRRPVPMPEAPRALRTVEAIAAPVEPVELVEAASEEGEPAEPLPRRGILTAVPAFEEEEPKAFPVPPKPRLIASRPDPMGSVAIILAEIMEPGRGKVEIMDVFTAYAEVCKAIGKRPIPAAEFPGAITDLCKRLGIQMEDDGRDVFLLKVRLRKSAKEGAL